MKRKSRWMAWILAESARLSGPLPGTHGARDRRAGGRRAALRQAQGQARTLSAPRIRA